MTDDEVPAIEAIVMAVSAGRVMMQHKEASCKEERTGAEDEDCEC